MLASISDWLVEITNLPPLVMHPFGFFQMLDVLILFTVLYLILKWIKRTQAWVLLKGIVFIAVVAILAELFSLVAVQWIVRHTIGMGLVVVVILFQPELRKVLEQLGRGQYLFPLKNETEQKVYSAAHTIDEIIVAVRTMSNGQTGALIVLEQNIDLSEHEENGVPLDAQVSAQLLLTIFDKNAPLHDGAVIIRNNRISSASCILPLSAEHIDSALGTRHRAAIGITEVADARVVIVSEETGIVSIAIGGEIQRDVTEKQIRDLLMWGEPVKTRFSLFRRRKS
ncbi:MAG: diadenylate cyclase CdaA [Firmicutes bacterium]|nr:diadenylate cyclase CdaA [Bacillota bacterium]